MKENGMHNERGYFYTYNVKNCSDVYQLSWEEAVCPDF